MNKERDACLTRALIQLPQCFAALEEGYNAALTKAGLQYKISRDRTSLIPLSDSLSTISQLMMELKLSDAIVDSCERKTLTEQRKEVSLNVPREGLAAPTLETFTIFFQKSVDPYADTFMIDPDENNPRAKHVYAKAEFKLVSDFIMERGVFKGQKTSLMVKKQLIE